jgi:hypothetical protein
MSSRSSRPLTGTLVPWGAVLAFCVSFVAWAGLLLAVTDGAFGEKYTVIGSFPGETITRLPAWPAWVLVVLLAGAATTVLLGRIAARTWPAIVAVIAGPTGWVTAGVAALLWRHAAWVTADIQPACGGPYNPGCAASPTTHAWWPWWVDVGLSSWFVVALLVGWWAWRHRRSRHVIRPGRTARRNPVTE